jgi:hypothetical protein
MCASLFCVFSIKDGFLFFAAEFRLNFAYLLINLMAGAPVWTMGFVCPGDESGMPDAAICTFLASRHYLF